MSGRGESWLKEKNDGNRSGVLSGRSEHQGKVGVLGAENQLDQTSMGSDFGRWHFGRNIGEETNKDRCKV